MLPAQSIIWTSTSKARNRILPHSMWMILLSRMSLLREDGLFIKNVQFYPGHTQFAEED